MPGFSIKALPKNILNFFTVKATFALDKEIKSFSQILRGYNYHPH
jgi:hypothetical protein